MGSNATERIALFRADGDGDIGTGHVMRMLSLAQSWCESGGRAHFACAHLSDALACKLREEGMGWTRLDTERGSVQDWRATVDLAAKMGVSWVVTDGYLFDADYQKAVKDAGFRLLFVDDYGHASRYCADLVLNQNIYARESLYQSREGAGLLLGTRYALLRRDFRSFGRVDSEVPEVARRVLVTLGGADPDNVTLKVVRALDPLEVEADIIIGGSNPHEPSLRKAVSRPGIRLLRNVDNMPELMARADLAVVAGGTTSYEIAYMGLPALMATLADNQEMVTKGFQDAGAAHSLGWHGDVTVSDIRSAVAGLIADRGARIGMSERGRALVDGRGCGRVVRAMSYSPVRLRNAEEGDCRLLWEWANDPGARAVSFSSDPIPWERHMQWFQARLTDPNTVIYIAEDNTGAPLGQVRFDRAEGGEGIISISLDGRFRGRGLGALLIRAGCEEACDDLGVTLAHAYIKPDNAASIRAFEKARFTRVADTTIKGHTAVEMVRRQEGTP